MLKKSITFEDFDGNKVTKDFYFHLTKAEIVELELSPEGSFADRLRKMVASQDRHEIMSTFKYIIGKCYGVRSEDGKTFTKPQQATEEFLVSEAYSELFMELISDPSKASEFITSVVPSDLAQKVLDAADLPLPEENKRPAYQKENRDPTQAELMAMSKEEIQEAFRLRASHS